jgi:hypothetical protein
MSPVASACSMPSKRQSRHPLASFAAGCKGWIKRTPEGGPVEMLS